MALLIDTSVLVDAERARSDLLAGELRDEECAISVITVSELLHGVHRAVDEAVRARRGAFVEGVLARLAPIPIGAQVARVHADVWARLHGDGGVIGAHDLWIAATALAHGMDLVTANLRDFQRVPGLSVLTA